MAANPMTQFEVYRIGPEIKVGAFDISFTNASLFMIVSSLAILIIFNLGSKLIFEVNSPGHPFLIKSQPGVGKKNSVEGIEKNGLSKGVVEWEPKQKGTYYYQCVKHKNMVGKIIIQ